MEFGEVIAIALTCSVKFVVGVIYMLVNTNFGFLKSVLVSSAGGMGGVLVFYFFSSALTKIYLRIKQKRRKGSEREKVFTRKNRFLIKIKNRFGIVGIALLTPIVLSIPLGCFLVARFYHTHKWGVMYLMITVLGYSISLFSLKDLLLYIINLF